MDDDTLRVAEYALATVPKAVPAAARVSLAPAPLWQQWNWSTWPPRQVGPAWTIREFEKNASLMDDRLYNSLCLNLHGEKHEDETMS